MHIVHTLSHPLLLPAAEPSPRSATPPAAAPAAPVPARDRESEAAWLTLGGSVCRRARDIGAARRAATATPAQALADLSAAIDRAEGAR